MTGRCGECGHDDSDFEEIDRIRTEALAKERLALCRAAFAGSRDGTRTPGATFTELSETVIGHVRSGDLHSTAHLLHEIATYSAGLAPRRGRVATTGRVRQLSVSRGGVPKRAVESSRLTYGGLFGDVQEERRHHGHPWQAVSCWSFERIEALAAAGHPIGPGFAGENLTIEGLDWDEMCSGVVLTVADATIELTGPATPCKKNAQWFFDRDFRRIDHGRYPGWSRWYATVLSEGEVSTGDPVEVLTPSEVAPARS